MPAILLNAAKATEWISGDGKAWAIFLLIGVGVIAGVTFVVKAITKKKKK